VVEVARLDRVSGADLAADVDDLVAAMRGDDAPTSNLQEERR
jgi:hypothetical protein